MARQEDVCLSVRKAGKAGGRDTRRNEALFQLGSGADRQRIASVISCVSLTGLQRM